MTERTGPRCPYRLDVDYRPVLAVVATARAAGRPAPLLDWRCVREPHLGTAAGGEQHLCMPLGVTGRSVRFSDTSAEPLDAGAEMLLAAGPSITAAGGWCAPASWIYGGDVTYQPVDVPPSMSVPIDPEPRVPVVHAFYAPEGSACTRTLRNGHRCGGTPDDHLLPDLTLTRRQADPADVTALIELIERPGTSCLHIADGDELLLLMPEGDDAAVEQATQALADLFPTVSFLVLQGITGAIRMPRPSADPLGLATPEPGRAAYEALMAGHADLADQRQHLVDQGVPPADLLHPRRPIPPTGYQPPPRQA